VKVLSVQSSASNLPKTKPIRSLLSNEQIENREL
jgi:hypothetical protein